MLRGKFDSTNQKHYPDLVSARHRYGISVLVSQTSFGGETSGSVAKCQLFSQVIFMNEIILQYGMYIWMGVPIIKELSSFFDTSPLTLAIFVAITPFFSELVTKFAII